MGYVLSKTDSYMQHADHTKDFTCNGKCSGCGSCCTAFLPMTDGEIKAIKRYIREHDIKPCDHGFQVPLAEPAVDMICPFRDDKRRICTIYEVRPTICKAYQCNIPREESANTIRRINPGLRPGQAHFINARLTFFGGNAADIMATRMTALKQKVLLGSMTDNWL